MNRLPKNTHTHNTTMLNPFTYVAFILFKQEKMTAVCYTAYKMSVQLSLCPFTSHATEIAVEKEKTENG